MFFWIGVCFEVEVFGVEGEKIGEVVFIEEKVVECFVLGYVVVVELGFVE